MDLAAGRPRAASLRRNNRALVLPGPWIRKRPLWAGILAGWMLAGAAAPLNGTDLHIAPAREPVQVFAGVEQRIPLLISNDGERLIEAGIRAHVYQTSSATAATWDAAPWQRVRVLPGQTVLEYASLTFPSVRSRTRFVVHWLDGTNLLGITKVWVYPAPLLKELKPLAGAEPLGLYDPGTVIKPLLQASGHELVDLGEAGFEYFRGRLAIVGPLATASDSETLQKGIAGLARRGAGVVCIQPPEAEPREFAPSCYAVREGKGAVVFAQSTLVENLAVEPQAQLNLIGLARLAVAQLQQPHQD